MLVNPKRRKRRKTSTRKRKPIRRRTPTRAVARRRNPIRRRRKRRENSGVLGQIMDAGIGAGGALAVDVAMAQLPIPDQLTASPAMRSATQGAVSITLGWVVSRFLRQRRLGRQLAQGGLTVALHGVGKGLVGPMVGLSGMDDSLLGYNDSLLGMGYSNGGGWVNPAGAEDFPGYADLGYTDMDSYYDM